MNNTGSCSFHTFQLNWCRGLIFIFLLNVIPATSHSQNWTVGNPVNTTVIDFPDNIFVTQMCDTMSGQEAEFRISLPAVTGISYFAVIDYASNPNFTFKLRKGNTIQILSLGDSMEIVPTYPVDTIHLGYSGFEGEVSLKFIATGTPVIAGQNYPCGSTNNGWYFIPIGCMMPVFPDPATYLTTCIVQPATGLTEINSTIECRIFPNPASEYFTLTNCREIDQVTIINLQGKTVLEQKINPADNNKINLPHIPKGYYLVRITDVMNNVSISNIVIN